MALAGHPAAAGRTGESALTRLTATGIRRPPLLEARR